MPTYDDDFPVTFEDHRWYVIVRYKGEFLRAFAGGAEFSGIGTFDTQEEFDAWQASL